LTIARELVELMSGEIIAHPNDAGAGSTFSFTAQLPEAGIAAPAPHHIPGRDAVPGDAAPVPRRVLLAEDNDVNRLVATTMLEQRGLIVDAAHDGVEAVQMHADREYAAIFMDCEMPELDGYEATRRIRASQTARRIPIIALSAHAVAEAREDCLAAGMDDYVSKPLTSDQLERALARWLPWHQCPDELDELRSIAGHTQQALALSLLDQRRPIRARR
jgi:CheY-like chemotaxis protein